MIADIYDIPAGRGGYSRADVQNPGETPGSRIEPRSIQRMTIAQIKKSLQSLGVSIKGLHRKQDYVDAYLQALDDNETEEEDSMEEDSTMEDDYRLQTLSRPLDGCSRAVQGQRAHMEDVLQLTHIRLGTNPKHQQEALLYALYDGHGGVTVATMASELLPAMLVEALLNTRREPYHICQALRRTLLRLDEYMYRLNLHQLYGGSTCVLALIIGGYVYVANLGDSRGLIFDGPHRSPRGTPSGGSINQDGQLLLETHDHKPLGEYQRILNSGGTVRRGRVGGILSLSRGLGDYREGLKLINGQYMGLEAPFSSLADIQYLKLPEDRLVNLVLACDGLWDVMSSAEVMNIVSESLSPAQACTELITEALHVRRSTDNITVLVAPI